MAYPTVNAPYGFQPINRVDGMPYAGATRQYQIDDGANIFHGDLVNLVAGKIFPFTGTVSGYPLGVFMGAQYSNSSGQPVQGQYYPAGAANGIAYVVVDDQAAYRVVVTNGSVVDSSTTIVAIGTNMTVLAGTGDTTTGNSGASVLAGSEGTSDVYPVRVIDVVPATETSTGYPELIVKINVTQFQNATGVD
tara:strand:+ start:226 stop:801 length:576 start_codon:yes stop_codon:yes gene_type:complete